MINRPFHRVPGALVLAVMLTAPHTLASVDPSQWSNEQKAEFLKTAKVESRKTLSIGITGSVKVTMSDGRVSHAAHWQIIDQFKPRLESPQGTEFNFRDSYRYNVAAYKLDQLLGLNMVPVSVERRLGGEHGALTWWVDKVVMMEKERHLKKIEPPDQAAWNAQMYRVRVFNELIYNTDPNLGNVLIAEGWRIWIIDFTRAFRIQTKLRSRKNLEKIDRELLERLKALDARQLSEELYPILRKSEIKAILARRDQIVEFFNSQIDSRGAAAALSEAPAP